MPTSDINSADKNSANTLHSGAGHSGKGPSGKGPSGITQLELEKILFSLSDEMSAGRESVPQFNKTLKRETSLSNDLGFDSYARMELKERIETEFGVSLTPSSILDCSDIGQLFDILKIEQKDFERSAAPAFESLADILVSRRESCDENVFLRAIRDGDVLEEFGFERVWQLSFRFARFLLSQDSYRRQMLVCLDLDRLDSLVIALFGTLLAEGLPELSWDTSSHMAQGSQVFYLDESGFAEAIAFEEEVEINGKNVSEVRALRVAIDDGRWLARGSRRVDVPVEIYMSQEQLINRAKSFALSLGLAKAEKLVFFGSQFPVEILLLSSLASLLSGATIEIVYDNAERGEGLFWGAIKRQPQILVSSVSDLHEGLQECPETGGDASSHSLRSIIPFDFACMDSSVMELPELLDACGLRRSLLRPLYGLGMGGLVLTAPLATSEPREVFFRRKHIQRRGIAREVVSRGDGLSPTDSDALAFTCLGVPHLADHIRITDRFGKEASDSEIGQLEFQLPYERFDTASSIAAEAWCTRGERGFFYRGELYLVPPYLAVPYLLSWLRGRGHALRWYTAAAFLVPLGLICILGSPTCRMARIFAKFFARALFSLGGTPLSLSYSKNLDKKAAQVLVANHASFLDAIALTALLPTHVSYAVKKELENAGIASVVLRKLRVSFVERFSAEDGIRDIEAIQRRVADGETFVFFPEGTFTRRSELSAFRLGAFKIAAEVGCDVVPLVIRGSRSVVRDVQFSPRPGRIDVEVFSPYSVPAKDWNSLCELRDQIRSLIAESCGEPDALKLL